MTAIKAAKALHKYVIGKSSSKDTDVEQDKALELLMALQTAMEGNDLTDDHAKRIHQALKQVDAKFSKLKWGKEQKICKSLLAMTSTPDVPTSATEYRNRLTAQRKEMYKDPPVLPPLHIQIRPEWVKDEPKIKKDFLNFAVGDADWYDDNGKTADLIKEFQPNQSPEEVLRGGSFGGTYYRPIVSAVTNQKYTAKGVLSNSVDPKWIEGLDLKNLVTSNTYRATVNKFGSKCGGSLGMWESSGWISDVDPYGWFQWYCRFYQGRRCTDDARQIMRWKGVAGLKGRFRSQLCNKVLAANTHAGDISISPVIRQTLFHWGLLVTEQVIEVHKKRRK